MNAKSSANAISIPIEWMEVTFTIGPSEIKRGAKLASPENDSATLPPVVDISHLLETQPPDTRKVS